MASTRGSPLASAENSALGSTSPASSRIARNPMKGIPRRAATSAIAPLSMSTAMAPVPAARVLSSVVVRTWALLAIAPACTRWPLAAIRAATAAPDASRRRSAPPPAPSTTTLVAATRSPQRTASLRPPAQPVETNMPAGGAASAASRARAGPTPVRTTRQVVPSATTPRQAFAPTWVQVPTTSATTRASHPSAASTTTSTRSTADPRYTKPIGQATRIGRTVVLGIRPAVRSSTPASPHSSSKLPLRRSAMWSPSRTRAGSVVTPMVSVSA